MGFGLKNTVRARSETKRPYCVCSACTAACSTSAPVEILIERYRGGHIRTYLSQERVYRIYVGIAHDSPREWKQVGVEGQMLTLAGENLELEDITAFLVVYPNGEVLDTEQPFFPLPEGVRFIEPKTHTRIDILNPSELDEGQTFVKISFGPSASRQNEPNRYSTTIHNISNCKIRVQRFAAFKKSGSAYRLNTISGDYFSADEFINWYHAPKDGWILPGESVTDPNSYGGGNGYWVCYVEMEDGNEFAAGIRIPQ